jgi:hypothetical protein
MSSAGQRAAQLALVSRLKTTFPEIPEWPMIRPGVSGGSVI